MWITAEVYNYIVGGISLRIENPYVLLKNLNWKNAYELIPQSSNEGSLCISVEVYI